MFRSAATTSMIALTLLLAWVPGASGHSATLQSIDPEPGSTIAIQPATLRITYSDPVELRELEVDLPDGRTEALVATTDGATTIVQLPAPYRTGTATVRWSVPQADGHVVEYDREFTIGQGALAPRVREARIAIVQLVKSMRAAIAALA